MLRRLSILVLLVAGLTAVEPLLHSHPLQQNSIPEACAICATGTTPLPSTIPAIVAPQIVVYTVSVSAVIRITAGVVLSLASRAPPA